ncbi:RagB/SusD family nutrient uptake outer membrane protein [Ancylomarina sp. 16SWW S1-10-2]|uniref:RagB/SusD family nutrient uptake outer membrane protein n=1 Tax=Ancylomarina sp. 16SWW S1-10-2 TaxID=2499681 RepID=UPI0012AE297E|nr:RagB/SusD family nutrient uptake outer membrane protein [Ancylomarina sp. 16SWW S1-10-2]MRT93244.1 RagB/SusD family nutrient uptake outer membrane protein [Ancylomarina sp. 16SWW S1-10-2]
MNIIYKGLLLLIVGSTLFSCEDYLDKVPDNRTDIKEKEQIGKLLVNAYPKTSYAALCETMSDNVGDKGSDEFMSTENTEAYKYVENFTKENQNTPIFYWNYAYAAIAHANQAIKEIEELESNGASDLDSYRGEALVCRAYAHFMLVNLFAVDYDKTTATIDLGIPYVEEVETELIKEYKRNTVAEVYEKVEADLLEGLDLLDDNRYSVPKYHFTVAAAKAFASRFYLWRERDESDLSQSISYANDVLGVNPSAMIRDYNGFYTSASYSEKQAQFTKADEKPNLLLSECIDNWGYYYPYLRFSLSAPLNQKIFMFSATLKWGMTYSHIIHGGNDFPHFPKWRNHEIKDDPNSNSFVPSFMMPLFTTDELVYNRLEAFLKMGDVDAALENFNVIISQRVDDKYGAVTVSKYDINHFYTTGEQVLFPPYVLPTYETDEEIAELTESMWKFYHDLKRKDFIHEGMRWFDIRRFELEVTHETAEGEIYKLEAKDPKKALQIPEIAIANGLQPNKRN